MIRPPPFDKPPARFERDALLRHRTAIIPRRQQRLKDLLSTYSEPDITAEQIEDQALDGRRHPLRQFSYICLAPSWIRVELRF